MLLNEKIISSYLEWPCDKRVTLVSPCENDFISNNIRNICNSAFATLLRYNSLFATTVGYHMTFFNLCSARSSMQMQVLQEAPVDQVPFAKLDSAMKSTVAGLNSSLRSGFASKEVLYNKTTWNLTTNVFFNHKSNLQEIYFWLQGGNNLCALRVTEARAEDSGEWECEYELPGQSDKVGHHHFWTHHYET